MYFRGQLYIFRKRRKRLLGWWRVVHENTIRSNGSPRRPTGTASCDILLLWQSCSKWSSEKRMDFSNEWIGSFWSILKSDSPLAPFWTYIPELRDFYDHFIYFFPSYKLICSKISSKSGEEIVTSCENAPKNKKQIIFPSQRQLATKQRTKNNSGLIFFILLISSTIHQLFALD